MSKLAATLAVRIRLGGGKHGCPTPRLSLSRRNQRGAAAVEFALVLPILLIILLGIIDFGLYFYSDLQLNHSARDAVRYLSLGDVANAEAVVNDVKNNPPPQTTVSGVVTPGSSLDQCSVSLAGTYSYLTPLPTLFGIDQPLVIDASATMRQGE